MMHNTLSSNALDGQASEMIRTGELFNIQSMRLTASNGEWKVMYHTVRIIIEMKEKKESKADEMTRKNNLNIKETQELPNPVPRTAKPTGLGVF